MVFDTRDKMEIEEVVIIIKDFFEMLTSHFVHVVIYETGIDKEAILKDKITQKQNKTSLYKNPYMKKQRL